MRSILSLGLLSLASLASAHFLVNSPPSLGFDDSKEGTGPCGGFAADLSDPSKLVDFHAGGDAISLKYTHTSGKWLFRVTDDPKAESGWRQIFPIVSQTGIGDLCEPHITIPDDLVGKAGVIGIVADAPDGLLYQCIAANFVSGVNANLPSSCKNTSSIKVDFSTDAKLTALLDGGSSTSSPASNSSSPSSTKGSSSPSASPTHNAAAGSLQALSFWTVALAGGALLL